MNGAPTQPPATRPADDARDHHEVTLRPRWATAAMVALAWFMTVSWMAMISCLLTGDRVPALTAAGVLLAASASVPLLAWAIRRHTVVVDE